MAPTPITVAVAPPMCTRTGAISAPTAVPAMISASSTPKTRASTSAGAVRWSSVRPATSKRLRAAPADVLARVFGVLEALIMAGTAVGALIAPVLVHIGGATATVIGVGAILPLLALLGGRRLLALDASAHVPVVEIGLLRSLRLFSALPPPQLEGLARSLEPLTADPGEAVVTQGEEGDRYYAIASGELEVTVNDVRVNALGRGEGFGEIALLHGVKRTATVRALTPVSLYALEGEVFLEVLTGHPATHTTAHEVAAEHLSPTEPETDES